ncbi:hypothetical protein NUSPORA_00431 [Nucleospora cyclopteri]
MNNQNRTAYVDFEQKFRGVETKIKIFETNTHIFVYVNQNPQQMHLYNEYLTENLKKFLPSKRLFCICNLDSYECLKEISNTIVEIIKTKN